MGKGTDKLSEGEGCINVREKGHLMDIRDHEIHKCQEKRD